MSYGRSDRCGSFVGRNEVFSEILGNFDDNDVLESYAEDQTSAFANQPGFESPGCRRVPLEEAVEGLLGLEILADSCQDCTVARLSVSARAEHHRDRSTGVARTEGHQWWWPSHAWTDVVSCTWSAGSFPVSSLAVPPTELPVS